MKPNVRTPLLAAHLWTGLIAGVVLIVVALSGALLVFRPTFERASDPARFIVTPGPARLAPDELVARALPANASSELESIRFYGDATAPFLVYFKDKRYVHLNPYTGEVLGIRARYGEGFGWIEGLHKYLAFPPSDLGEKVNGSFSLVFIAIIASGFVLWWPATRRALKAALTLNPKLTGRPWNLNLHKALGAYAGLVLLASAFTGLPIAFDFVKAALYPLTNSVKPVLPKATSPADAPYVGFTAIGREVGRLMPGARETYIPLPKNGLVAAYAIAADAPHAVARSYAYFDGGSAKLLRHTPYAQAAGGFRLYYWMMAFHLGYVGGWPVKIILLLGVLAVPVLAYTGAASYLRRKFRSRAPVVPRAAAPSVAVAN
jgi:uncharacterized iron-regulated membrane protein